MLRSITYHLYLHRTSHPYLHSQGVQDSHFAIFLEIRMNWATLEIR